MKQELLNLSKDQIADFLPEALSKALKSYKEFSEHEVPEEPKEFTAHHNACKVAIAHVELLIKLAKWTDVDVSASDQNEAEILSTVLKQAEQEVSGYFDQEGGEG